MSVIRFILNRKCPGGFPGHFLSAQGANHTGPKDTPICVILQIRLKNPYMDGIINFKSGSSKATPTTTKASYSRLLVTPPIPIPTMVQVTF